MIVTVPVEARAEHRPLIYIVDDEPLILDLVASCLGRVGYPTKAFDNPLVACSAFELADPKPDLLVLDYSMREMRGSELLRRCRAVDPKVKALRMSGAARAGALWESEGGPDGFIRKPFKFDELLAQVQRLVG